MQIWTGGTKSSYVGVTDALQWKKPCLPCSEPKIAVAKARWPGWGVRISGGGYSRGQKAGLHRPHFGPRGRNRLWPRRPHLQHSPEPARHSQRKRGAARASGEVRASRPPPRRFAAPGPLPASLRRAGSGTELHLPGSATRAAVQPAETTSQPGRRPGSTGAKGRSGTGKAGGAPPTRQRVAGQCAAPAVRAALRKTLVCVSAAGRRARSAQPGPRASVRPAGYTWALGAGISRALTLRSPGAHRGPPERRVLSTDSAPPSRARSAEPALAKPTLAPPAVPARPWRGLCGGAGSDPAGERVSRPSRPCSPGEVTRAAGGRRISERIRAGASRARVGAAAGTARARLPERAGRRGRLGRVSAGACGRLAVGGAGRARGAG